MRTHYCGGLRAEQIGQEVELNGWINRRRDHGGVIFVDLRDREGIAQVVFDPDREAMFVVAERLRSEFVIRVRGWVRNRPDGTVNSDLPSGEVEVLAHELEVLNSAKTPPIQVAEDEVVGEDTRLKYRYVDLRRPAMQQRLMMRAQVVRGLRHFLDDNGFLDIDCLLYTSPSPRDLSTSRMPSSA